MNYLLRIFTTIALAFTLFSSGCGEGTLLFGGEPGNIDTFVTVAGNIHNVTPVSARDVVVFVFTNLAQSALDTCSFNDPKDFDDGELVVLPNGSFDFSLSRVQGGDLTVVFLLDKASTQADGQIDAGDPIAVLDDPDNRLLGVQSPLKVTIERVDITFSAEGGPCPSPLPGQSGDPGTADAFRITRESAS